MVGVGVPCADMAFGGRRRAVEEWWFRASSFEPTLLSASCSARLSRGWCHHHQERKAVSGEDSALQRPAL